MDRRSFIGSSIGAGFYAALLSDAKAAGHRQSRVRESNSRLSHYKGDALPTELTRRAPLRSAASV